MKALTTDGAGSRVLAILWLAVWLPVRMVIYTVLVFLEPVIAALLVPLAFLNFLVTLIFGFLIGDPHFPKWGMLAFSIGTMWLYWLFLGLMSLFVRLP
jgi:hypothetical protein